MVASPRPTLRNKRNTPRSHPNVSYAAMIQKTDKENNETLSNTENKPKESPTAIQKTSASEQQSTVPTKPAVKSTASKIKKRSVKVSTKTRTTNKATNNKPKTASIN